MSDVHLHSCLVHPNFEFFGTKKSLAPMAHKHSAPNFERARTFSLAYVLILEVHGWMRLLIQPPNVGVTNTNHRRNLILPCLPTGTKALRKHNAIVHVVFKQYSSTVITTPIAVRQHQEPLEHYGEYSESQLSHIA